MVCDISNYPVKYEEFECVKIQREFHNKDKTGFRYN